MTIDNHRQLIITKSQLDFPLLEVFGYNYETLIPNSKHIFNCKAKEKAKPNTKS